MANCNWGRSHLYTDNSKVNEIEFLQIRELYHIFLWNTVEVKQFTTYIGHLAGSNNQSLTDTSTELIDYTLISWIDLALACW
jgi:hypothetical protein